ncbi:MAG: dockerin type I repeat-containing protein, partial [Ruminococcus sp.]
TTVTTTDTTVTTTETTVTDTETTTTETETTTITTETSSSETTTTETIPADVLYGDINLDKTVSMVDVIYLNKYIADIISFNAEQTANADCVNDSKIDSADATALLKFLVNKVSSLPLAAQ